MLKQFCSIFRNRFWSSHGSIKFYLYRNKLELLIFFLSTFSWYLNFKQKWNAQVPFLVSRLDIIYFLLFKNRLLWSLIIFLILKIYRLGPARSSINGRFRRSNSQAWSWPFWECYGLFPDCVLLCPFSLYTARNNTMLFLYLETHPRWARVIDWGHTKTTSCRTAVLAYETVSWPNCRSNSSCRTQRARKNPVR